MKKNSMLSFLKEKSFIIVLTLTLVSAGTMAALFVFGNRDQVDNQEIAKKQEILAETPLVSETKEEKPKESAKETVMEPVKRVVTPAPSVNTETAALEAELEDQYLEAEEFAEVSADEIIAEGFLRPDLFTLSWPVEGEVILPFSMDRSVYFKTLAQYQYNPAMLIGAEEGTEVFAAAKGTVIEVSKSNEYGHYVVMDLGDGYELIYGQLFDISIEVGETLEAGDRMASIGYPTRSYLEEGDHLYLKLTKDGAPVNPELYLKK